MLQLEMNLFNGLNTTISNNTDIFAIIGALVLLIAVNDLISPNPFVINPIEGSLFVQLYKSAPVEPVNIISFELLPLHSIWLEGLTILGVGLTVIEKLTGKPLQPLEIGVSVIIAVCVFIVLLTAVNAIIFPAPLEDKPMEGKLLVQV